MVSLFVAVVGIVLRHLPHLIHVPAEPPGSSKGRTAHAGATLLTLSPLLWGLGALPTATVYAGLLSFRAGRREGVLIGLFVVSCIALATFAATVARWAGPPSLEEPSLLVDRALRCGADQDLSGALATLAMRDPSEPLYPFATGTLARRVGDF